MIADPRQLYKNKKWFNKWLDDNSESENSDFKNHVINVMRKWLDEKNRIENRKFISF